MGKKKRRLPFLATVILAALAASIAGTLALIVVTNRISEGEEQSFSQRLRRSRPALLLQRGRQAADSGADRHTDEVVPARESAAARWYAAYDPKSFGVAPPPPEPDCSTPDSSESCEGWAQAGECDANAPYMHMECAHACKLCGAAAPRTAASPAGGGFVADLACVDKSSYCGQWAAVGECDSNPGYMKANCRVTCHLCQSAACHDMDAAQCKAEAAAGACQASPESMFQRCRWSCGWCAMVVDKRCRRDASFPGQLPAATAGSTGAMFERSLAKAAEKGYAATVLSRDPWVVTYDHFLSADEASAIISKGEKHWSRSVAGDGVQSVRTSSTAWCEHDGCGSDPVLSRVRSRIANLTGVPEAHAEPMQILRYEPGQFYRRHHDQNAPATTAWGPRLYTFFMYLSEPEAGGETSFPVLNLSVAPKLGRALLWPSVLDHDPLARDDRTDHEAVAVGRGVKFASNYWLHLWDFQGPNRAGCSNTEVYGNW